MSFLTKILAAKKRKSSKHKFIKDSTYKKRPVWISERYPKERNSGYSKQVVYMDKTWLLPLKIVFYDLKGALLKVATFSRFKKINGFWRANKLRMLNKQTKKESAIIWKNRRLKVPFFKC